MLKLHKHFESIAHRTHTFSAPLTLIGFTNREKLYCTSEDLSESFPDETAYCTVAGICIHTIDDHAVYTVERALDFGQVEV